MYPNLSFFELSKRKILQLATVHYKIMIAGPIIEILENISMNKLPNEVKWFVSSCDNPDIDQCTLIGSSDSPPMCCTTSDFTDLYFLAQSKPPPTDGFKEYKMKQIDMCEDLLRNDSATSPSPPLFPPPAPSPSPCPFNSSYDCLLYTSPSPRDSR